jgi:hypothetical protein
MNPKFKRSILTRRERELASKIRAPAEAEKYKLEIMAQANRVKSVSEVVYTFTVIKSPIVP